MSAWFDKLKELVKIDIRIHDLIKINIHSNDSSERLEYSEGEKSLSINLEKLTGDEKEEIGQLLRGAVGEGVALLEKHSVELIEDIKSKEESEDVRSLLEFFKDKIPIDDWNALRAAIYIRKRFEEGTSSFKEIYHLKGEVGKKYGKRGLKICNLCTSGYFETKIKPLYEEISQQGFDEDDFLDIYNVIIDEEAFALFVSGDMSRNEVKSTIEQKIKRNLNYGIKNVTIHGIGKNNMTKIREAISGIEDEHPNIKKDIEEKGNIILAKLSLLDR